MKDKPMRIPTRGDVAKAWITIAMLLIASFCLGFVAGHRPANNTAEEWKKRADDLERVITEQQNTIDQFVKVEAAVEGEATRRR